MLRERAAVPPAPGERSGGEARRRDGGGGASAVWHLRHGAHLAACVALLGARGRQAVLERDAGALLSAITVCGLDPHWLAPGLTAGGRAIHGVTAAALDAALRGAPGARAAIVALRAPDVAGLVEAAHAHGAALVVDASGTGGLDASGAGSPAAAIAAGADLVVGAEALLLGREPEPWLPRDVVERAVALAAGRAGAPPRRAPEPAATVAGPPSRFVPTLPAVAPGPTVCSPRAAWLAPQERVAPAAAVGRIAAEALTPAVPGVPAVLPGERLIPDVVATVRAALDRGGVVHGARDGLATIAVLAERRR